MNIQKNIKLNMPFKALYKLIITIKIPFYIKQFDIFNLIIISIQTYIFAKYSYNY